MAGKQRKKKSKLKKKTGKKEEQPHNTILASSRHLELGYKSLTKFEISSVLCIFILSMIVRIAFYLLNSSNNPVFEHPIMDSLYHDDWAKKIVSGDFWGNEVFFRAPLYPYFLALLYKIGNSSISFAALVQHITGSLSAVLIFMLARVYFARPIAFVAGIIAALYWPFVYFEGQLLIVTLIILLDLCFLISLSHALNHENRKMYLGSGIILGLSSIARPNILIIIPFLPIIFRTVSKAGSLRKDLDIRISSSWLHKTLLMVSGALIVITPIIVRNYIVAHDIVPIASQGGVNFYIGNNPKSDGRTAIVPGTRPDWWGGYYDAIHIAEEDKGRKLKPSEVSNYYFHKGVSFIFSSPGKALGLFLHKFRIFWSGGERANNQNIYFFWHLSGMGSIPLPGFWLICPLGILGGIMLWRQRHVLSHLYLFIAAYSFGVIAFFVNARFRLPVAPVLIVFASFSLVQLYNLLKQRRVLFIRALAALAIISALVNMDFITFKENKVYADTISHYTLGNAYLKSGKPDKAIKEYETSLANYKKYSVPAFSLIARNVYFNLGSLYHKRGRCDEAIELLTRVRGNDRYTALARRYLGECYARKGMLDNAERSLLAALELSPGDRNTLLGLADVYIKLNDRSKAQELILKVLKTNPEDTKAKELLRHIR